MNRSFLPLGSRGQCCRGHLAIAQAILGSRQKIFDYPHGARYTRQCGVFRRWGIQTADSFPRDYQDCDIYLLCWSDFSELRDLRRKDADFFEPVLTELLPLCCRPHFGRSGAATFSRGKGGNCRAIVISGLNKKGSPFSGRPFCERKAAEGEAVASGSAVIHSGAFSSCACGPSR